MACCAPLRTILGRRWQHRRPTEPEALPEDTSQGIWREDETIDSENPQAWQPDPQDDGVFVIEHMPEDLISDGEITKGGLCEQCRFLCFRASPGGFTEVEENGQTRLTFPERMQPLHRQGFVKIRYQCNDDLPDLPRLRKSALAGCSFCGLLRESLLKDCLNNRTYKIYKESSKRLELTVQVFKVYVLAAYRPHDRPSRFAAVAVGYDILPSGSVRSPHLVGDTTNGTVYFKLCANPGTLFCLAV